MGDLQNWKNFMLSIYSLGWQPKDKETALADSPNFPQFVSKSDAKALVEYVKLLIPVTKKLFPDQSANIKKVYKELIKLLKIGPVVIE